MPDLVEAQAARTPSAVAVVAGPASLTFGELDARANDLAWRLQGSGVRRSGIVGVCLPRSLDVAVALLGVLKAGGACLPLDPSYPRERLELMVADARPVAIVTTEALAGLVPATAPVIPVGAAVATSSPPLREIDADDLAYVIYTSGSTGVPKGVLLTHGGLVNHHRAAVEMYALEPGDQVLQFCSLSFDASIEELFPTWAAGATVVFRPDDAPLLGRSWLRWLDEQGITVANLPTAYWHEWVRDLATLDEKVPGCLRLVVAGGEKARGAALRAWAERGGSGARWFNVYGPTEATCMATAWEADFETTRAGDEQSRSDQGQRARGSSGQPADPPIGRPLPNVLVRIVGGDGVPVSTGEAGELHIGGAGLARGYLRRPDITAERFVRHAGERWYRTGDIVRARNDGELEFVGRVDDQVKVHGFRVECHEVEAAIETHPQVDEAVVVARDDEGDHNAVDGSGGTGGRRLVAYVVSTVAADQLRRHVADRLPPHMVPSAFVPVASLPRTPNGKVDRGALPDPDRAWNVDRPWAAPRHALERRMAALWAAILGIDADLIGREDDFFELGGHSLLAMQLIAQVSDEFATTASIQAFMDAPTVASLASLVESEDGAGDQASTRTPVRPPVRPPIRPREVADRGARLPLGFAQEQMWNLERAADPPGLYNVTTLQRLARPVDESALRHALAYLVSRHEALRTSISSNGHGPYQVVHAAAPVDLTITDLTGFGGDVGDAGDELQRRVAIEDARPLPPQRDPLFRANLFHVDDERSELAVTFDHLVCDGTAAYVFMAELAAAYDALRTSRAPTLAPLAVQPADFAVWQRDHVTEDDLRDQIDWWAGALDGMPLGPAVAFDHIPDEATRHIASHDIAIDAATRGHLHSAAQATRSTVFVVAAALFESVLGRWGGTEDVLVSTTLSGRARPELDGLVGMFSGIGRVRGDLTGNPTFLEIVRRTRRFVFGMYEHQDVPFMRVREELFPDFPTGGHELFAALPVELQYFRTAHTGRERGTAHVSHEDRRLHFRGQLHPLSLTLLDDGTEMAGRFSFKLDYYEPGTIQELAQALERVLRAVGEDPTVRLSALPV